MSILVHALQRDGLTYAVEIDHQISAIVSIYDVHNSCFVDDDQELEAYILDCFNKAMLPPMEYSQWLSKKEEDLLLLDNDEFSQWVDRMKSYCDRRRGYCKQKYPHFAMQSHDVMRDLYPHWTWLLADQIKKVMADHLTLKDDYICRTKQHHFVMQMDKWANLTGLQP